MSEKRTPRPGKEKKGEDKRKKSEGEPSKPQPPFNDKERLLYELTKGVDKTPLNPSQVHVLAKQLTWESDSWEDFERKLRTELEDEEDALKRSSLSYVKDKADRVKKETQNLNPPKLTKEEQDIVADVLWRVEAGDSRLSFIEAGSIADGIHRAYVAGQKGKKEGNESEYNTPQA